MSNESQENSNKMKDSNRWRKNEELEDATCSQMKAKTDLAMLATYKTVTNDIKFAEVLVLKLEEKVVDTDKLESQNRLLL